MYYFYGNLHCKKAATKQSNKMKNTVLFNSGQIRTKEVPGLVNSLLEIVERHDPEAAGVKAFYELLKEQQPQLELLTNPRIRHPLSELLKSERTRANELCAAIITQVNAAKKGKLTTLSSALLVIEPIVQKYLTKNYKSSQREFDKQLNSFLLSIASTESVRNAAKAIGIDVYCTELSAVKVRIDENNVKRSVDYLAQRSIKELKVREAVNQAITNLLRAIELAKVSTKTYNFGPLVTELNLLFTSYRALVRSRSTRRLNNAIKKESAASTAKSVATETLENVLI